MKCPSCGQELVIDNHRKIDLLMCYNCGYIQGRSVDAQIPAKISNYKYLLGLDCAECAAFLAKGLGLPEETVLAWLIQTSGS